MRDRTHRGSIEQVRRRAPDHVTSRAARSTARPGLASSAPRTDRRTYTSRPASLPVRRARLDRWALADRDRPRPSSRDRHPHPRRPQLPRARRRGRVRRRPAARHRPRADPARRSTACASRTSSRPTSTTTTSPAASRSRERTGAEYLVNGEDDVSFDPHPRGGRQTSSRWVDGCASPRWRPPATRSPTSPTPSTDADRRRPAVGVFSGGSLLYGATGRPDLLGPEHTHDLVRHQHASAHRLADAAARRRRGLPDPRLRLVLLGHPVRRDVVDHRPGEADQPRPHPGRADLRRRAAGRARRRGRPTTRTWRRPTPPVRPSPT